MKKLIHHWQRWGSKISVGLALIGLLVAGYLAPRTQSGFQVHVLDVGQGDGIHIHALNNFDIVVDGGPNANFSKLLRRTMSSGDRLVDLVISTHPDADHLTGLVSVLKEYQVGQLAVTNATRTSNIFKEWQSTLTSTQVPILHPVQGDSITVPGGRLTFLWPLPSTKQHGEQTNDVGIVFRLDIQNDCMLFTADVSDAIEKQMAPVLSQCALLKVGHHGSATTSTDALLTAVHPQKAIISVGKNNRYGHPTTSALQRLSNSGARIYRTDQQGTITITWPPDGEPLKVTTAR